MAKETILLVDDEKDIIELLEYNLKKEGYATICAYTGEEALRMAWRSLPDLIVLDLMLPGVDGLEVCRNLKQEPNTRNIPILMLTAKGEDSDIIIGLEIGADDYITKPFSPKVLIARIRALLRRSKLFGTVPQKVEKIHIHSIEIDVSRHEVTVDDQTVELSITEFGILEFLARNPGWVFTRNQIIGAVKGNDYPVTERSVDVQILGLRKKIGNAGAYIQTVRGIGYRMQEENG